MNTNTRSQISISKLWRLDAAALGICLLLTWAIYFVGFKPIVNSQAKIQQQHQQLAQQSNEADKLTSTLTTLRNHLDKMHKAIADSAIQLQTISYLNQRVAAVTALATNLKLRVDKIQPGNAVNHKHYDIIPISLTGTGAWTDCSKFLHELRTKFADTGVSAFELTGHPENPDRPASFRFSLQWYAAAQIDRSDKSESQQATNRKFKPKLVP